MKSDFPRSSSCRIQWGHEHEEFYVGPTCVEVETLTNNLLILSSFGHLVAMGMGLEGLWYTTVWNIVDISYEASLLWTD